MMSSNEEKDLHIQIQYKLIEELRETNQKLEEEVSARKRELDLRRAAEKDVRKAHEELEDRVRERTSELERLNETLKNEINDRKTAEGKLRKAQDKLILTEKMAAIGQLAGGVAHEVQNPLATMMMCVNYLEKKNNVDDAQLRQKLSIMKDAIIRADKIIKGLLKFSSPVSLVMNFCEINELLDISIEEVEKQIAGGNIKIEKEYAENLPLVRIDKHQMKQAFTNILLNAVQSIAENGTVFVKTYVRESDNKGSDDTDNPCRGDLCMVIEIKDTGMGIEADNLNKVCDAFFTTKPPGKGSGLGLAIVRAIVESHKGHVDVKSAPDEGTKVTVMLPVKGTV